MTEDQKVAFNSLAQERQALGDKLARFAADSLGSAQIISRIRELDQRMKELSDRAEAEKADREAAEQAEAEKKRQVARQQKLESELKSRFRLFHIGDDASFEKAWQNMRDTVLAEHMQQMQRDAEAQSARDVARMFNG